MIAAAPWQASAVARARPDVAERIASAITGIVGCCARATTGHAAALPSPAMNSRRPLEQLPNKGKVPGPLLPSRQQ